MINSLINFGAVPFGYTSDLIDSDIEWPIGEQCIVNDMNWLNFRSPNGLQPLPDVILSNTPPPSPLRRAHSYHFLFPEKADTQDYRPQPVTLQRSLSVLPTPPPTPTSPSSNEGVGGEGKSPDTPGGKGSQSRREDPEVNSVRTRVGHIQEIRRRHGNPAHFHPHQSLPQLSWEVPRVQRSRRTAPQPSHQVQAGEREGGKGQEERGGRRGGGGGEEGPSVGENPQEQRLRQIGTDLRRIADQFQADNGTQVSKKDDDSIVSWVVPASFTKCLSVSLLFLVWWRLLNKLH